MRFGPAPGSWCQKSLHGHTEKRYTMWTVVNAGGGVQGDRSVALKSRGCSACSSLCSPVSKVECGHRVHREAVGSGKTCNCTSGHLASTSLVFSFSDVHCSFCLFFYTGTVED